MLKKMTIRNFKAITDMTIEFTPLTVLIGGNSCGKSTVLQAIDFLRSAATRDIPEYLRERGWSFSELKSQFNNGENRPIEFISEYKFFVNGKPKAVKWDFSVDFYDDKWDIKELIVNDDNDKYLLIHNRSGKESENPFSRDIYVKSSLLNFFDIGNVNTVNDYPELRHLKDFLQLSQNFESLTPNIMRNPIDVRLATIGLQGKNLAIHCHTLVDEQKDRLNKTISYLIGYPITIETEFKGVSDVYLYLYEIINASKTKINIEHISDGLLRIIAIAAITTPHYPESKFKDISPCFFLLDEIEDGVNPYLTEKVVDLLKKIATESSRQIIVTTHSPVVLNDFNPDDIVFLWKDKDGSVHCKKMFSTEEMRESLDFLNPGEIWLNYGRDAILRKLNVSTENE
jgi:predicted ATPase